MSFEISQILHVGLLTGGGDRHYAFGLAMGLVSRGIAVDFVGGDEVDSPEMHTTPLLTFFNVRRSGRPDSGIAEKLIRLVTYYWRLILYAANAKPKIFHILWNNRLEVFDRTLLMLYYRVLGKKIILTAHNVNAGIRDSTDGLLNRWTLRFQYQLCCRIFVHTELMKAELISQFGVKDSDVIVIPYGINNAVPNTSLTSFEARKRLGIQGGERVILFFGNIAPYKGLEYLIQAFEELMKKEGGFRLIIAGRPKRGFEDYVQRIRRQIDSSEFREHISIEMSFIPDEDMEVYFKAADLSVLPYTHIFQSGVLFLGFSFGLPVVVADVGALREDIVEGETGYVFTPRDTAGLASVIGRYFSSDLYRELETRRPTIREFVINRHSWDTVGEISHDVYENILSS